MSILQPRLFLVATLTACGGNGAVEGDLTCLGQRTAPLPGDPESVSYVVKNPTDDVPYAGAEVHVFPDGVVRPDCVAPDCQRLEADGDGIVDVSVPRGWFAYRVIGDADPDVVDDPRMTTVEVFAVHPPDDDGFLNALFTDSMEGIFSFAAGQPDHDLGKAVLRGVDCNGDPLANLRPRATTLDGEPIDIVVAYLNRAESFPAIGRLGTHQDGRAFMANLPPEPVRVELWGDLGSGTDELVACELIPVEAGATTTVRMRPLRADAPDTCGSADPVVDVPE